LAEFLQVCNFDRVYFGRTAEKMFW